MKTIYNTFVIMESQNQCDRMKQLCIDNGLSISTNKIGFEYNSIWGYAFKWSKSGWFGVYEKENRFSEIAEQEFIELLKQSK